MSYNEVVPMEIYVIDYQEKVKDFVVDEDLMVKYLYMYVVYIQINVRLDDLIEYEYISMMEDLSRVLDEFHRVKINRILFDEEKIQ
jgi:hypothetical protein